MRIMVIRILCFWAILLSALPVTAAEPLIFRSKTKDAREASVIEYLRARGVIEENLPLSIAATDLNNDGVDEWIVRQEQDGCRQTATCPFAVAGLSRKAPLLLGDFAARKVGISGEKAYGVRKLLVYNLKNDDFAYTVYVWSPSDSAFRPE